MYSVYNTDATSLFIFFLMRRRASACFSILILAIAISVGLRRGSMLTYSDGVLALRNLCLAS